ncbi:MAG: hypothetical protein KC435_01880 [Thermomicrobiales bacterium]|nr:hypothetical protein [Thermomicrobiales bacterium]
MHRLLNDIAESYQRNILDAHKQPQALILVSFLLTFLLVRFITHSIRAGRFTHIFHNVKGPGGTHLHHLVPGILLLLLSGYLGIGLAPNHRRDFIAIMYGIGAALTLDEFALWLHLKDVYWAKQGRQSIDAVVIAASFAGIVLLGGQFWLDVVRAVGRAIGLS